MNVLVFASRKGGSGKSTLAAHLASCASRPGSRALLIDADPQGSLSLWHGLRGERTPSLRRGTRGMSETLMAARDEGGSGTEQREHHRQRQQDAAHGAPPERPDSVSSPLS